MRLRRVDRFDSRLTHWRVDQAGPFDTQEGTGRGAVPRMPTLIASVAARSNWAFNARSEGSGGDVASSEIGRGWGQTITGVTNEGVSSKYRECEWVENKRESNGRHRKSRSERRRGVKSIVCGGRM